jgi:hypothetical protein
MIVPNDCNVHFETHHCALIWQIFTSRCLPPPSLQAITTLQDVLSEQLQSTPFATYSMLGKRKHARHRISEKVAATATSWLDVFPDKPTTRTTQTDKKPSIKDAKLFARIEALKQTLENDIKPNIEIRAYFLRLYRRGSKVCFSCSATDNIALACGPDCSLLNPFHPVATWFYMKTDWHQHACESIESYHRIVKQIQEKGENAGSSQIKKWEIDVQILKKEAFNYSEIREGNGWTKTADYSKASKVFVMDWTFEGAWGTQKAPLEDIGPDEV